MIIDTKLGMKIHQDRIEELRDSASHAQVNRKPARPTRSLSFRLGAYRLNIVRETAKAVI